MKQLPLLGEEIVYKSSLGSKKGRPSKLTPKKIFEVLTAIKNKKSNTEIIKEFNLSKRTFFRIKKGNYNHLLKIYLDEKANDFSLDFCE